MTVETCDCRNSFDSLQRYLRNPLYYHPDRPFNYDWKKLTDIYEQERWYFRTAKVVHVDTRMNNFIGSSHE